jgi:hypothetical protein
MALIVVAPTGASAPQPGEVEASMNFDLVGVRPFLKRLSAVVEGFGAAQVSSLADDIAKLPIDSTLTRTYKVAFNGKPATLRIEVFMDDMNAPDIHFFSSQPLAHRISVELRKIAEVQGQ